MTFYIIFHDQNRNKKDLYSNYSSIWSSCSSHEKVKLFNDIQNFVFNLEYKTQKCHVAFFNKTQNKKKCNYIQNIDNLDT